MSESKKISPDLQELELSALLEVTEAINNNLSEESLYKIYRFSLLAGLKVRKLALFVLAKEWECKVHFGVPDDSIAELSPERFVDVAEAQKISDKDEMSRLFEMVIPVRHKDRLLAVVFIGEMAQTSLNNTSRSSTTFLEALTNIILVAIENKKLARQQLEQEALRKELEIAKQVQQFLFPKTLPNTDKLEIDAFYRPHHDVGGDYYDYIPIDDEKFLVCIADVSGKGVPAALIMSNFQASLRTLIRQSQDLVLIVNELNYQLAESGNSEIFITFFVAIYDASKQCLEYANCGHNPPYLWSENSKVKTLEKGTTVMGMFEPLPFFELGREEHLKDFGLMCFTDGLSEATNAQGEEFGESRVKEVLEHHLSNFPKEINEELMRSAESFREDVPYRDDITLITTRVYAQ